MSTACLFSVITLLNTCLYSITTSSCTDRRRSIAARANKSSIKRAPNLTTLSSFIITHLKIFFNVVIVANWTDANLIYRIPKKWASFLITRTNVSRSLRETNNWIWLPGAVIHTLILCKCRYIHYSSFMSWPIVIVGLYPYIPSSSSRDINFKYVCTRRNTQKRGAR